MDQHKTVGAEAQEGSVRYDRVPNAYILSGAWPTADLTADAPVGAHYAQEIARSLRSVMDARSLSQQDVANLAGLGQKTISRVLLGDVYCDIATLARLEQALRSQLYPSDWWQQLDSDSSGA